CPVVRFAYHVFFMFTSWQVMQVMLRTAACRMIVPANEVKTFAAWHSSQAAVPYGVCAGLPTGGTLRVGGAMLANVRPGPWHCAQPVVMPACPVAPMT